MSLDIQSTVSKELKSFETPPAKPVAEVPVVGHAAPVTDRLRFPQRKPTVIVFLRHCGCPFAEKTFKKFTKFSSRHPEIRCVAVSHSSQAVTDDWVVEVGGEWEVDVLVDEGRDLYGAWGLGLTSTWHALNPWALYSAFRLGRDEGIWNRATGSGTRWQMSGVFAVERSGVVKWVKLPASADDIPDFTEALIALGLRKPDPVAQLRCR